MAFDAGALVAKLQLDAKEFTAGLDVSGKSAEKFKSGLVSVAKGLAAVGTAATAVGTSLFAIASSTAKAGDEVAKMSKRLNVSVEALSALRFQAGLAGTDFKIVANGIRFMTKAMFDATEGLETAKRGFRILGISVTDSNDKLKDAEDIFLEVADGLAAMEDGTEKTAAAQLIFGSRMGTQLIPLLNQGSEALREQAEEARKLGIIFDEEAAKKSEEFVDSMLRLRKSVEGVKKEIGLELIPVIDKFINEIKDWVLANKELLAQDIVGIAERLRKVLPIVVEAVSDINGFIGNLFTTFNRLPDAVKAAGLVGAALFGTKGFAILIGTLVLANKLTKQISANLVKLPGVPFPVLRLEGVDQAIKNIQNTTTKANLELAKFPPNSLKININEAKESLKGLIGTVKSFPQIFEDTSKDVINAADDIRKKWKDVPDEVKAAFESLGIISKEQFEQQVRDQVSAFETIVSEQKLTDEELLRLREALFERLKLLAEQAEEEGVLGIDIEKFKTQLSELHQDLLNQSTGTTQTIQELGNTTTITLRGFLQDSTKLASDAISGIEGLIEKTIGSQISAFSTMTDELDRYKSAYIAAEETITNVVKAETEERLSILQRFVQTANGLRRETGIAGAGLPITPVIDDPVEAAIRREQAEIEEAIFRPRREIESSTINNINQTVNINNAGNGSVEQGQDIIRAFNQMDASLAF